jgi:hypothetical protein
MIIPLTDQSFRGVEGDFIIYSQKKERKNIFYHI